MGHYEVLGVDPTASMAEIRRTYLRLARESHPDLHQGSPDAKRVAEVRMRELNAAWAVLGDVDQRSAYDRRRLTAGTPPGRRFQGPASGAGSSVHEPWRPFDEGAVDDFDDRDDRPITASALPRWLAMVPVLVGVGGAGAVIVGSLIGVSAFVGVGIAALVGSAALFMIAPIIAVARSSREDRHA